MITVKNERKRLLDYIDNNRRDLFNLKDKKKGDIILLVGKKWRLICNPYYDNYLESLDATLEEVK